MTGGKQYQAFCIDVKQPVTLAVALGPAVMCIYQVFGLVPLSCFSLGQHENGKVKSSKWRSCSESSYCSKH